MIPREVFNQIFDKFILETDIIYIYMKNCYSIWTSFSLISTTWCYNVIIGLWNIRNNGVDSYRFKIFDNVIHNGTTTFIKFSWYNGLDSEMSSYMFGWENDSQLFGNIYLKSRYDTCSLIKNYIDVLKQGICIEHRYSLR